MKKSGHPNYNQATVKCACGETFVTGSTKKELHVDICSKCHGFFTGSQNRAKVDRRIDRFNEKLKYSKANPANASAETANAVATTETSNASATTGT